MAHRHSRLPALAVLALLVLLVGLGLSSCSDLGEPVAAPAPAPDDEEPPLPVSFAAEVLPILVAQCQYCHFPEIAEYASLVGLAAPGYGGLYRVAAGDTAASVLYQKINGNPAYGERMPWGGALLPEQIALIGRWIREGAADN